jgi:D-xylono/L-arabinono-1,4-lactonase
VSPELERVANYHCVVGENPLWNADEGRIYWADIDTGRLFRADHRSLQHECFYRGPVVGGFSLQADGSLLLFEEDRIATLDGSGRRRVLQQGIDPDMRRFNDVIADPEGRVFAGSIGKSLTSGGLYRVERDGSVALVLKETGIANGMGFSADLRRFYWTSSTPRRIFVFDYRGEDGALSNRRLFYEADESAGTPDGLTLDAADGVWSAHWGGSAVLRLGPEGGVLARVAFPVSRVSSLAFGGPELDCMYVTTAGGAGASPGAKPAEGEPEAGTLYRVRGVARGRPEFRSRVGL